MSIEYIETDDKNIDSISGLWKKLNQQHRDNSPHFSHIYADRTFEWRKNLLLKKSELRVIRVILAKDNTSGEILGYCVGSISGENQGEIDSIFVESEYRKSGIGDELMKRALNWMNEKQVEGKTLGVAAGNEHVFGFYGRYGFYPKTTILEQVKND